MLTATHRRLLLAVVVLFCGGLGGAYAATVKGDDGANQLTGTPHADTIRGFKGADTITARRGVDTVRGGAGDDVIYLGPGHSDEGLLDHAEGGPGADTIHGQAGQDEVRGQDGSDTVTGGDGRDVLDGGEGSDTVKGGRGRDFLTDGHHDNEGDSLYGGRGPDGFVVNVGTDSAWGNGGDDVFDVVYDLHEDTIRCGPGSDTVTYLEDQDPHDRIFGCETVRVVVED